MVKKRLYSLYQRSPSRKRWQRVSHGAMIKERAVRVFQNALLSSCINGWRELRLRPVKNETLEKVFPLDTK